MAYAANPEQAGPVSRPSVLGILLAAYDWLATYWERTGNGGDSELPDHIRRIVENRNYYI